MIEDDTFHHLVNVLRISIGDQIILFNGKDNEEYIGVIDQIKKRKLHVLIREQRTNNVESPLIIHLGQAISKGERMDFTFQKATELGVTLLTPLFSKRSVVHLKHDAREKKLAHWQKILIHSSEQCGRTKIPLLNSAMDLQTWIKNGKEDLKIMLDTHGKMNLPTLINHFKSKQQTAPISIALLIGPEGGLSQEEKDYAIQNDFTGVLLGPRILRTETASIAALTALQLLTGDL